MKLNARQQFEVWEKAYFATLAGFSAREGLSGAEVVKQASYTADQALQAYIEKGENFTKVSTD